jgi:hypothetical protein
MTYISAEDARRENSEELVEGFPTPKDELFRCTCHGKRWSLKDLRMENNGQRHCPNQARPQGGSIDRTMIENRDRVELQRRAVDDARPVKWPFSRREDLPIVHSIAPRPAIARPTETATIVISGLYLKDTDEFLLDGPMALVVSPAWAPDGTSCTVGVAVAHPVGPQVGDINLFYNGAEYDGVVWFRQ